MTFITQSVQTLTIASLCLASGAFSVPSAQALTKRELVLDVFQSQRDRIYDRFHRGIEIVFEPSMEINAAAGYDMNDDGQPVILIYGGVMKVMSLDALAVVTCHEIGHHLGNMTFKELGDTERPENYSHSSVEGEADYYGGKCAKNYFMEQGASESEAIERAIDAARETFQELAEERLPPAIERGTYPGGVDMEYPDDVCRMVSVEHGARGLRRPECWYNPRGASGLR